MEAKGIYQSDLLIKSAIQEGFRDLRANQWKLDYIFRGLLDDPLTVKDYGQKQLALARKWLLSTDIAIFIAAQQGQVRFPCISISLQSSSETDNTLGDVHYETSEDLADPWPALAGPFTPKAWDAATNEMTLPVSILDSTDVFPGMNVVDSNGAAHSILEVKGAINRAGDVLVVLDVTGTVDFNGATIRAKSPTTSITLESVWCKESYQIGCHVQGDPLWLTILHSAVAFIFFHYRQSLFEERGFELSNISSSDFAKNQNFEEPSWSRYIVVTGQVQQVWPKLRTTKIIGINPAFRIDGSGNLPTPLDPNEQAWIGDLDNLTSKWR